MNAAGSVVLHATFDDDGTCRVVRPGGEELACFQTVYSPAFNRQYPPPLSPDGRALYVGSWERGLHCYDVPSGDLRWRQGPGKVRRIYPYRDGVLAEMCDRGIYRRSQCTGDVTGIVKMKGIEAFYRLNDELLFAGPHRRDYRLYSIPGLEPLQKILGRMLNPNSCLSFSLFEVFVIDGRLVCKGREEYPNGDYSASGARDFRRYVQLEVT